MATALSTRTDPVFQSKSHNSRITRFPELSEEVSGVQRQLAPGLRFDFDDGVLRVDADLRFLQEQYIERYGHLYPKEQPGDEPFRSPEEFLRWRAQTQGKIVELPVPVPDPSVALGQITELVIEGELDTLRELRVAEAEEWGRPEVLEACDQAIAKVEERQAAEVETRRGLEERAADAEKRAADAEKRAAAAATAKRPLADE